MRRSTRFIAALTLTLAGCGVDPATCRLGAGSEAIGRAEPGGVVGLMDLPPGSGILRGWDFAVMPAGTRVRVVADDEHEDRPGARRVRVLVLEGDRQGTPARIWREQLRPAPP